ncbi:MAG: hypothetical protein ACRD1H_07190 [Vicinamibacterales bacterium]
MSVRTNHVPIDRLTALAFVARAPETEEDQLALGHVSQCNRCATELARLTADADSLREASCARADTLFDDTMLEVQRSRILDRLANLGQVARVLRFPRNRRDVAMPVSTSSRRWVSVAAAAGLIIGLVAGQLLNFVPWQGAVRRDATLTLQTPARQSGSGLMPVSSAGPSLTDDKFLDEIEAAVQLRRAHSLRALDALTPTAGDVRDFPLGPR